MGIPHLITLLRPYSELCLLDGQEVVIDGPAWAYHIYHICLGTRLSARGPFQALPSYEEIADTAIEWLDGLRQSNVSIKKIYFDGRLPPSKFDVRIGRVIALTQRLSSYHCATPYFDIEPPISRQRTSGIYDKIAIPTALTALPVVPFLVPAVLEALISSHNYRSITTVVPGEADEYCSHYLSQHRGIVLTADSDLLVYNLGAEGSVGFFRTIQPLPTNSKLLQCHVIQPAAIVKRLSLPKSHGMRSLAFELLEHPHGSFPELLARAKRLSSIIKYPTKYREFQKEYHFSSGDLFLSTQTSQTVQILQSLDARVSEYVLQFPHLLSLAGGVIDSVSEGLRPHVFLPFLLDCPSRSSAWEMSTAIRQVAYALINISLPQDQQQSTIFEHRRQQSKSKGREIHLLPVPQLSDACTVVLDMLVHLQTRLPLLPMTDFWTVVAVYQDVEWSYTLSKPALSAIISDCDTRNVAGQVAAWDIILWVAQIEASYYSFRLLKQIISLVVATHPEATLFRAIKDLHQKLSTLPHLSQLKNLREASSMVRLVHDTHIIEISNDILGVADPSHSPLLTAGTTKKKRKKQQKKPQTQVAKAKTGFSNTFDVLGVE